MELAFICLYIKCIYLLGCSYFYFLSFVYYILLLLILFYLLSYTLLLKSSICYVNSRLVGLSSLVSAYLNTEAIRLRGI